MNDIIILNPDYYLKNDLKRIILYSKNNVSKQSNSNWMSFLHPLQATILSFFTHGYNYSKCIKELSHYLSIEPSEVDSLIRPYINNPEPFFTEWNDIKIRFPKNVLIKYEHKSEPLNTNPIPLKYLNCKEIDLTSQRLLRGPHLFTIMLNNRCLTNCNYCYADRSKKIKELTTEQILNIADEAKKLEVSNINVIGGEVFLKKDWNIILSKLVEYGMMPEYISTKVPITRDIVEKLRQSGYTNVIQISLDSMNDKKLSQIIGSKSGYKDKIVDGINLLQEYGFKIQINTVLTKSNSFIDDIQALYNFIKTLNNLIHWEIRVVNQPIYNTALYKYLKPSLTEFETLSNYIRNKIIPTAPIRIIFKDDVLYEKYNCEECSGSSFGGILCGALTRSFFVLPDGQVTLCEELYWHPHFIIGDLKESTIREIWCSDKANSLYHIKKEEFHGESICIKCNYFDHCHTIHKKCWTQIIRAYGIEKWYYPDPHCEKAPKIIPAY